MILQGYDKVAECLNLATRVDLLIWENTYIGEIESLRQGEGIVFKIKNVDQHLLEIPEGSRGPRIRATLRNGDIRNFETRILVKKFPLVILAFPKEEIPKVERKYTRVHTNLSTPIILVKREFDLLPDVTTGMGTISNVSQGGCSIVTYMKLQQGDIINFFMEVNPKGDKKTLDLHGAVRSVTKLDTGNNLLGVQYQRMPKDLQKEITEYMIRRGATPVD